MVNYVGMISFHVFKMLFETMLLGIKYMIYSNFLCFHALKIILVLPFTLFNHVLDENMFMETRHEHDRSNFEHNHADLKHNFLGLGYRCAGRENNHVGFKHSACYMDDSCGFCLYYN